MQVKTIEITVKEHERLIRIEREYSKSQEYGRGAITQEQVEYIVSKLHELFTEAVKDEANRITTTSNFISIKGLAKILAVSNSSITRLINSGELPGIKIGNVWRVKKSDANLYAGKYQLSTPKGKFSIFSKG